MNAIETAVRVVVDLLANREYLTVERVTHGRRLSAEQIEGAVAEYGRTLVKPGDGWWEEVTITPIDAGTEPSFHVAAPVWTLEEGRSDLTLELRLTASEPEIYTTEVLSLHVL